MYDVKEQAKIYLERIDAARKQGGPFLLVMIPLIILLIMGIAKNYMIVKSYIANQELKMDISKKQVDYKDSIDRIELLLSKLYKDKRNSANNPDSINVERAIKYVRNKKKNRLANLGRYNDEQLKQNKVLQSQIDSMQIPFEIPFIKRTENLTIRTVVAIVMLLITSVLVYLYTHKRKILSIFKKFADLQSHLSVGNHGNFKDVQLNVPPWFFPINNNYFQTGKDNFVSDAIGFSPRQLKTYNFVLTITWLVILALNIYLVNMNWNINYKVYHTNYSPLIVICLILLTIDVFITYKLISPIFGKRAIQSPPPAFSQSRVEFISLSAAALACFVFEPVNNLLYNGKKWFHNPRFQKKKNNVFGSWHEGFYTNVSKSKKNKLRVYYLLPHGGPIFKTVPDAGKFIKNMSFLKQSDLQQKKYLSRIEPEDLLQHLRRTNIPAPDALTFLNKYLDIPSTDLPPELIDSYSSFYQLAKTGRRRPTVHKRIAEHITQISNDPSVLLPGKYQEDGSSIKDEKQRALFFETKKELKKQLLKRIQHWKIKLNNAGTSPSSMQNNVG